MKPEFITIASVLLFTLTCMIGMNFRKMVRDKFKELLGRPKQHPALETLNVLNAIRESMALREAAARFRIRERGSYDYRSGAFVGEGSKKEIVDFDEPISELPPRYWERSKREFYDDLKRIAEEVGKKDADKAS